MQGRIYIDVDGTVLGSSMDWAFKLMSFMVGSALAVWLYNQMGPLFPSNLRLNVSLLEEALALKEEGYVLVLWTNRDEGKVEKTKKNLGEWWYIFDEYVFAGGSKTKKGGCVPVQGSMVWDNESKNRVAGCEFRLIESWR